MTSNLLLPLYDSHERTWQFVICHELAHKLYDSNDELPWRLATKFHQNRVARMLGSPELWEIDLLRDHGIDVYELTRTAKGYRHE